MAKKRKKRAEPPAKPTPTQEGPFHNPFAGLSQALKGAAPPPVPEPPPPPGPEPAPELDDQGLFDQAMAGVERLRRRGGRVAEAGQPPRPFLLDRAPDEDLEVLAQLADLVSGGAEFDLRFSDEYVEGALPGVGPELRERLARGEFPVQDYLDMHGLGQDQALEVVERFLLGAQTRGLRHVLLVHGRGQNSPGGVPVLKRALAAALAHKRLRKKVLAFCTARPVDGGTGAMYVLLRKWQGPGRTRW